MIYRRNINNEWVTRDVGDSEERPCPPPERIAKMLVKTTGGYRETVMDVCVSDDPREIADFFSRNMSTAGVTLSYAVHRDSKTVLAIYRRGKIGIREAKTLVEAGFREFQFNIGFAGKLFEFPDGERVEVTDIDLIDFPRSEAKVLELCLAGLFRDSTDRKEA